jgi:predicted permease
VSAAGAEAKTVFIWEVGPDFFTTMQIPILRGREIQPRDMTHPHLAAVVSQDFARENFAGGNPLGQFLGLPDCPKCSLEIVGVSADVLIGRDVRDERGPTVFLPFTYLGHVEGMAFELRTAGDPLTYVRTVRELVRQADPRLPVSEIRTQSDLIDGTMNREVVFARLCTGFALLALAIACVGLYGAMSYDVARRTGEIGIRMALGAERGRVLRMVLREALVLAAAGLAIGIPAALFATKLVTAFLFETSPKDPVSLAVAAASLAITAVLAGFLPARNASRIDPMTALRHE